MADKPLPDSAADAPHLHATSIDQPGFINPKTIEDLGQVEQLKAENQRLKLLNQMLKDDHYDERTDQEIFESRIEGEVDERQAHLASDEFRPVIKQDVFHDWGGYQEEHPQAESDRMYRETYSQRLQREEREAKERGE